jgi:hypothetical protein
MDSWLGQFGQDDDVARPPALRRARHPTEGALGQTTRRRRCQAPALRIARHPERGGGTERRRHMPVFFSAGGDSPLYQGVRRSVWDPEPSRERVGDWGGPEAVWALTRKRRCTYRPSVIYSLSINPSLSLSLSCVCVLPKGVPQGQSESGGIVLAAICWAPSAQR